MDRLRSCKSWGRTVFRGFLRLRGDAKQGTE